MDASGDGLGAVLSQIIDNKECVVAYASRTLTKVERKYCATRREMLALVWGIHQDRPYVYGQSFTTRTDHNALRWLQNFQDLEGQVACWLEALSEYNFKVKHQPGPKHGNADALSCLPCKQCGQCTPVEVEGIISQEQEVAAITEESSTWCPRWSKEEMRKLQSTDPDINTALSWLSGTLPSSLPRGESSITQTLWHQRKQLILKDGILFRLWKDIPGGSLNQRLQLIVPKHLVAEILVKLHNSPVGGHLGMKKTLEKVRQRFYWVRA